jgi:hypothetical protein
MSWAYGGVFVGIQLGECDQSTVTLYGISHLQPDKGGFRRLQLENGV